jgi:hypothetical protein
MVGFSKLPPAEVERRRQLSVEAYGEMRDAEFDRWYQEECDRFYWRNGRCCAGCDHWSSSGGRVGECFSAPPMSGRDIMASLGIISCSYTPPPGQPFTEWDHVCGAFQDEFDWSTLPEDYRKRIGAPEQHREDTTHDR